MHTHTNDTYTQTHTQSRGISFPATGPLHWYKQCSQEHSAMIWNLTQNVCLLELWRIMWRVGVMPNNHGRGRTAFKHFPCIRLLKWHSFAGCWHFSRAYCKHMELDVMSICDLNILGILLIKENQTLLDLCRLCGKTEEKSRQYGTRSLSWWGYITADDCK